VADELEALDVIRSGYSEQEFMDKQWIVAPSPGLAPSPSVPGVIEIVPPGDPDNSEAVACGTALVDNAGCPLFVACPGDDTCPLHSDPCPSDGGCPGLS
jgi:hypothetical protein